MSTIDGYADTNRDYFTTCLSMRLIFVNHVHPQTPHVGGLRAYKFALEGVKKGHRVILICEALNSSPYTPSLKELRNLLESHDWSEPLILGIRPFRSFILEQIRHKKVIPAIRKVLVTWSYLVNSGVFTDFSSAVKAYIEPIVDMFRPDLCWGIFGNTDAWLVAQKIACFARIPWVADVKDGWDPFIPKPLRNILARRFYDAKAMTANSQYQAELTMHWFPHKPVVVYSGVDDFFIYEKNFSDDLKRPRITLVGSTYSQENLERFIYGIRIWAKKRPFGSTRPIFVYAGGEVERVRLAARVLEDVCDFELYGYLPLKELFEICSRSLVNAYIWSPKTFHHKLIELICCGRPIIAFPGERKEAFQLANEAGAQFYECVSEEHLSNTLKRIEKTGASQVLVKNREVRKRFSWTAQAEILFEVFTEAVRRS
ncbi:MAG: hypothetical protein N2513_03010 [Deltaproteobacteria bacterium]|nr:hypothetical protein [Deltaproteobacteria bacterium]